MTQAITRAIPRWNPTKGLQAIAAPQAKPTAIDVGVPGIRPMRWARYRVERAKPMLGQKKSRK